MSLTRLTTLAVEKVRKNVQSKAETGFQIFGYRASLPHAWGGSQILVGFVSPFSSDENMKEWIVKNGTLSRRK